jgi:hypothetical protein
MSTAQRPTTRVVDDRTSPSAQPADESLVSGVSWGAVIAGAFVTAAIGLLLMTLGAGMGLSSISMWPAARGPVSRAAAGAVFWVILVQLLAGALGGYVAGRLRTKWTAVHNHEVFFRDTAHGLLAWAVSVVVGTALLGAFATSMARDLSGRPPDGTAEPGDYYADSLFRSANPATPAAGAAERTEARAILLRNLARPAIDPADRSYLAALVAARTGISAADAERRVETTLANQRQAIEESRKAIAHSLYWLVVALLVGAFAASLAAIYGGRRRDFVWS